MPDNESREIKIKRIVNEYNEALDNYQQVLMMLENLTPESDAAAFSTASACGHHLYSAVETALRIYITDKGGILNEEEYHKNTLGLCSLASKYLEDSVNIDLACLVMEKEARNEMTHSCDLVELSGFVRVFKNLQRIINSIDSKQQLTDLIYPIEVVDFPSIFEYCEGFKTKDHTYTQEYTYMMITDPIHDMPKDYLSLLLQVNWDIILDFDGKSKTGGLRSCADVGGRAIVDMYIDDLRNGGNFQSTVFKADKTAWLYLEKRGYCVPQLFKKWDNIRKSNLEYFLKTSYNTKPTKLIVLCLKKFDPSVNHIIEKIKDSYTDFQIVFVNQDDNQVKSRIEEYLEEDQYEFYTNSLHSILKSFNEFSRLFENQSSRISSNDYEVPGRDEIKLLDPNIKINLEDYFEILHLHIGSESENIEKDRRNFLAGDIAPWSVFKNKFDVLPINEKLYNERIARIKDILKIKANPMERVFIIAHKPGFGGTTLSRRVAWDIHQEHPVLRLKRYQHGTVNELIKNLYDFCNKGILLVADENDISKPDIEDFEREVKNIDRPVAALIVKRVQDRENHARHNTLNYMSLTLIDNNAVEQLKAIFRSIALERQDIKTLEKREKNMKSVLKGDMFCPFMIGLYYLDEDFVGIREYVKKFIDQQQDEKCDKALIFIAMCDYFGRKKLPAYILEKLFGDTGRRFSLKDRVRGAFELLVDGVDEDNGMRFWRPRHYLISLEIMRWLFNNKSYDENGWVDRLPIYCKQLIDLTRSLCQIGVPEQVCNILTDVFINNRFQEKNENGMLGANEEIDGDFSYIIEKMPFNVQKRDVLEHLITSFATYIEQLDPITSRIEYIMLAHFWGHLARHYSKIEPNFSKAIECCENAINILHKINMYDSIIYHIYGDCLYKKAQEQIELLQKSETPCLLEDLVEIKDIVDTAADMFIKTKLYGNIEHGVLSHIKMLISFLRLILRTYNVTNVADIKRIDESWILKYISEANELFGEINKNELSERAFSIYNWCEQEFDVLLYKKNRGELIQDLNNYLDSLNKMPIRDSQRIFEVGKNIVVAILKKHDNNYLSLQKNEKDVRRILELLDKNIDAGVSTTYDYSLWLRVAKYSDKSVDDALTIARKWYNLDSNNRIKDPMPAYYLYVLNVLRALDGYANALDEAIQYRKECLALCQIRQKYGIISESKIRDWFGSGTGLKRLIDDSTVEQNKFAEDLRIAQVKGEFIEYGARGVYGTIRLTVPKELRDMEVHFKPVDSNLKSNQVNHMVALKFGFSFERPVAFNKSIEDLEIQKTQANNSKVVEKREQKVNNRIYSIGEIVKFHIQGKVPTAKILKGYIEGTELQGSIKYGELEYGFVTEEQALLYSGKTVLAKIIEIDMMNRYRLSKKAADSTTHTNKSNENTAVRNAFLKAQKKK